MDTKLAFNKKIIKCIPLVHNMIFSIFHVSQQPQIQQ